MGCDVAVIGAGVVGLAVAAELAEAGRSVLILEKELAFGRGISSRNSEVVHAGIYHPPGSLKSTLCLEGRELLYRLCDRFDLPHRRTGKLIIASEERELPQLDVLHRNSHACGVTSVRPLDGREVRRLEPNVRAIAALWSPDTGIVSAHSLMELLLARARAAGAEIVFGTEVGGVERSPGGYRVETRDREGRGFRLGAERVVNAGGLHSDVIASFAGASYRLHYCKGSYFGVTGVKRGTVGRLVYPVPEQRHVGLGVHLTLDLAGRIRLGPDAEYLDRREEYRVDPARADAFYAAAARYLPFLRREDLSPDTAGIRPKLQGPGDGFRDFVISEDRPGFVNLVGIESPGLTASLAIGRKVRAMIGAA